MKKVFSLLMVLVSLAITANVLAEPAVASEQPSQAGSAEDARELSRQLSAVKKKFEDLKVRSENVTATIEERDKLFLENEELSQEAEELRGRLKASDNSSNIRWFITGALIFFAGWMLGAAGGKNKKGNPYY